MEDRRIFWALKFSIPGFFWVGVGVGVGGGGGGGVGELGKYFLSGRT